MEFLEAYEPCRSYQGAAELVGCSEHTAAHCVERRESGEKPFAAQPLARLADPYRAKVDEWLEGLRGKVRADICHAKLGALGYIGSERTTRGDVATAKKACRQGRVYRPWVPETGCGSNGTGRPGRTLGNGRYRRSTPGWR